MPAKTRSAQAGVGEALGVEVGDGIGDRAGPPEGEPHAELAAITRRRLATSAMRCPSDDFFITCPST
jgi:hypothetical protein